MSSTHGWSEPETQLVPLLCSREGVAVDVGAYMGAYTRLMGAHSSETHAFEPIPTRYERLARRRFVKSGNVRVHNVALSDRNATCFIYTPRFTNRFHVPYTLHALSSLEGPFHAYYQDHCRTFIGETEMVVTARTLDSYNLRGVAFVKIDVEGHEFAVLRGARATIGWSKPSVLVEIAERYYRKNSGVVTISAWFRRLRYSGWFLHEKRLLSIERFDAASMQHQPLEKIGHRPLPYIPGYVNNFLFLPEENVTGFIARVAKLGIRT